MVLDNIIKTGIGQEYFKRKIFRQLTAWFKEFLDAYQMEELSEKITDNYLIVKDIEKYLLETFSPEQIHKYLPEIELYHNSMTEENKVSLTRMIYVNLSEYRELFEKNQKWLSEQVQQTLIAIDSYLIKIKTELNGKNDEKQN